MTNLRVQNEKLAKENRQVNVTLQSTVAGLQRQMTEALTKALDKKMELENKLDEASDTITSLKNEIAGTGTATDHMDEQSV
jgi:CII-binding regulator of phage lambda lysogenization HflD